MFFVQEKFIWDKIHDAIIRKIFDHRMVRRLQQMLEDVCERRDHLTIGSIFSNIKKAMYIHWETNEEFKRRYLMNRANRASSKSSNYTCGLATFMKTKVKLKLEAVTQQSQQTGDNENNSTTIEVNPNTVWGKTATKTFKNCSCGLRSFFADNLRTFTLRPSSASTTIRPIDPEDGVDLRGQVLELT
ncbi:uncharacterized protein [Arachis hypogaea]|uniref:uncharacterized protein isoform X1 n=2 Tax=Arachis hypogaea TaxID=3818 RepID=UPI000A2C1C04|nr:uncharacterized protein LOC112707755 isoform X1 [Arachis hypogaea]